MAISKEDHKDVKHHLGKALANKVADATRDYSGKLRKGSGRTQEIANRIKAEHFKTSGQTPKKKTLNPFDDWQEVKANRQESAMMASRDYEKNKQRSKGK